MLQVHASTATPQRPIHKFQVVVPWKRMDASLCCDAFSGQVLKELALLGYIRTREVNLGSTLESDRNLEGRQPFNMSF